ncbi:FAD/NAD(P)-binding domain-containing protein [Favolaschia claudopus]|uniref:FAD/NAD(P)-binding domain-containing protein n=1 Tax=Favolaschia claudopus TaxID=2862362 RepID=A0AAW0EFN5_9AGAR
MNMTPAPKAVVVGAGPVGCLSAIALAKLGWDVVVYERRPDIRADSLQASSCEIPARIPRPRSINLTLSARGIAAVQSIDSTLVERLLYNAVPLQGRMVHHLKGNPTPQQYDRQGHCLYSIERGLVNLIILETAAAVKNISIKFSHKAVGVDFKNNVLRLCNSVTGQEFDENFDLCIGADGSNSIIRHFLMRATQMEYSQHYLSHEYVEIRLQAGKNSSGDTFLLDSDHLHVWPRGNFTVVAMPNKDKTFTCALFAPREMFDNLQYPDALIPFFQAHFPDLLSLLGEKRLLSAFQNNPRSQLITVKANLYHKGSVLVIGDGAHSFVPFFGQGLNCALEDVRILSALLCEEKGGCDPSAIHRVFKHYSESRHEDLIAIGDLAMDSHLKMRRSVATWSYTIRAYIDNLLYALSESLFVVKLSQTIFGPESTGWIPLYSMVSFRPDISYSAAKKKAEHQKRLVDSVGISLAILGLGYILHAFINLNKLL